jgi:hypothetical protein
MRGVDGRVRSIVLRYPAGGPAQRHKPRSDLLGIANVDGWEAGEQGHVATLGRFPSDAR